jgi:hypothetical protein
VTRFWGYYVANLHIISVEYHTELKGGSHRVKVSLIDLGMYINGFRVFPPTDGHDDWWVFPPQLPGRGKKSITIVEFKKSEPLWGEIVDKCIACVQEYGRYDKLDKQIISDAERSKEEIESQNNSYDPGFLKNPREDSNEYLSRQ